MVSRLVSLQFDIKWIDVQKKIQLEVTKWHLQYWCLKLLTFNSDVSCFFVDDDKKKNSPKKKSSSSVSSMSASWKENVKRSRTEEEEVLKKRPKDTRTGDQFKIPLRSTQERSFGQSNHHDHSVLPAPLKEKTGGWSRHDISRSGNQSSSSHHRSGWNRSCWDTNRQSLSYHRSDQLTEEQQRWFLQILISWRRWLTRRTVLSGFTV